MYTKRTSSGASIIFLCPFWLPLLLLLLPLVPMPPPPVPLPLKRVLPITTPDPLYVLYTSNVPLSPSLTFCPFCASESKDFFCEAAEPPKRSGRDIRERSNEDSVGF